MLKWSGAFAFCLSLAVGCGTGLPSPGGPCQTQKDCVSGELCFAGTCQPIKPERKCRGPEDCALDQTCDQNAGECTAIEGVADGGTSAGDAGSTPDSGADDAGGHKDSGNSFDAGTPRDSGTTNDAGTASDAGTQSDAGTPNDGGTPNDAGTPDAGTPDAGTPDAGTPDAGPVGLALGATCVNDVDCASRFCLSLTVGTTPFDVCSTPCGRTSDCPLDFSCTDLSGMAFCLSENLDTPPSTFDTPSGGVCTAAVNTCQSAWCNTGAGQCIEGCSREADCAGFGGLCWTYTQVGTAGLEFDNLCYVPSGGGSAVGAACTMDSNCISGVCDRYAGTCASHCCADADCPAFQSCTIYDIDPAVVMKICVPRSPTAGTLPIGASCAGPADCESEVCVAVDPNNAALGSRCSTLCCRESDCAGVPGGRCLPATNPIPNTLVGLCVPGS